MSLSGDPHSRTNFSLTNIKSHDIPPPALTTPSTISSFSDKGKNGQDGKQIFPFLHLPLELRLKIYNLLLPPRTHTIIATMPPTTYFYNSLPFPITSPSNSYSPSTYPFGHSSPLSLTGLPTPVHYKILTNYPFSSTFPAIMRTCKQVHGEAEEVLYANKGVQWNFGVHLEVLRAFWGKRSAVARAGARNVRLAFEVPVLGGLGHEREGESKGRKVVVWERMVEYLLTEMTGVRELDLTLWCADGSATTFPSLATPSPSPSTLTSEVDSHHLLKNDKTAILDVETQWRKHPWTKSILSLPSLRQAKITVWTAMPPRMEEGQGGIEGVTTTGFDSWAAGRMVGDATVRERMVGEGVVREEVFVLGPAARV